MRSWGATLFRPALRCVAWFAVVISTLVGASAAQAESWVHRDPAHDMYRQDVGPVPGEAQGDITRVKMEHRSSGLLVRVDVRELHKERYSYLDVFIRVPAHGEKPAYELNSEYYFSLGHGDDVGIMNSTEGLEVDCRPVKGTKSYRQGWLQLVVPRGCFGRAESVRAGVYFREGRQTVEGPFIATDSGTYKGVGPGREYGPFLDVA